ncbi:MAG: penicillin-binding protein 2 [SAR324 cluster bacterium]|nr:penicillin-binding protein 2 [SAR324 cluster bacterium]MCZ6841573.1 penicillin-binding protein 2 [SAR324 cluster bacterium]
MRTRLAVIAAGLAVLFLVLLGRLWFLQLVSGQYYADLARGNRIRVIPQEAPRGIIYDRNGVILAFNRPAFNIQLIPEDAADLSLSLQNLARVTGAPQQYLLATANSNRSQRKFKSIMLLKDIGRKTADLIDTYEGDLPGISVAVESKRLYPTAFLSSHVLGYVGVINESQLKNLPIRKLYSGRIVGQSGIESMLNDMLIGVDGGKQVEVDNVGRELRVMGQPVRPVPGHDITLTIDLRLQRYVRTLMAGRDGSVIVMKPRTGEILSMNSFPDFDPNLFVGGIKDKHWNRLTGGEDKPLINKSTQGQYPPGSIFKMILAAAGLDLGIIDSGSIYNCPGYFRLNREISYCWKRDGHGDVTLKEALAYSCNVYFYKLGQELGVDRISQYAKLFGLGQPTNLETDSEEEGLLPSKAWKLRVLKEKWYMGETVPVSIGQGYLSVTPIQLINYVNTLANRGLWVKPTLLRQVVSPDGYDTISADALPRQTRLLPIAAEHFDTIREGMIQAVEGRGTARRARSLNFVTAGKTGTSQVVGREGRRKISEEAQQDERLKSHALFVAFAPAHKPQVSVLVLVEHGGSGGVIAAPIGKKILQFYDKHIEAFAPRLPRFEFVEESRRNFQRELEAAFGPAPSADAEGGASPPNN